jgi:hypothetical protein
MKLSGTVKEVLALKGVTAIFFTGRRDKPRLKPHGWTVLYAWLKLCSSTVVTAFFSHPR